MALALTPLETRRRSTEVVVRLSDLILSGQLAPGARLPTVDALARQLSVARSVVREALASLEALGIVEIHQGKGTFIASLPVGILAERLRQPDTSDGDLLRAVWEVRETLETSIASMAAQRRTEEDLNLLYAACDAMEQAIARGESGYAEDTLFHHHLARATRNPVMLQLVGGMDVLIGMTRRKALSQPSRPQTSCQEHRTILARIEAGDSEGAAKAMLDHLAYGRQLTTAS